MLKWNETTPVGRPVRVVSTVAAYPGKVIVDGREYKALATSGEIIDPREKSHVVGVQDNGLLLIERE